ncbi:MAG TPA: hypothetical protein ENK55_09205 [Actinobacteria bacterium]|nr:hypothetical protein [Actinomycetota bacterium]
MGPEVDRFAPVPDERPIEAILAGHLVRRAWYVGPVIAGIAWLAGGPATALAAGVGVAVVLANFVLGGWLLSAAARVSLSLYHAAALFGFLIRLVLITVTMILVANVTGLDRAGMGIAAVACYLVLLALEAVAMVNGSERELEWSN